MDRLNRLVKRISIIMLWAIIIMVAGLTSGTKAASAGSQTGGKVTLDEGESFTIETATNRFGNYDDNLDILWKVKVPESCDVLIVFEYFTTQFRQDFLYIGNGTKKSKYPTWALFGSTIPSQIRMNFSAVWIRFSTSDFAGYRGFRASITPQCSQDNTTVDTVGSGFQALDGETYQIASPNYPNNFPPNTRLTWAFQLPNPQECRIYVTFLDFETEQDNDQVIIGTQGVRVKETFSGRGVLLNYPFLVQSEDSSTHAYVQFISSETSPTARGFMANVTADCEPGYHLDLKRNETYRLKTSNYPLYYPTDSDESWVIKVPQSCDILVEIVRFATQLNQDGLHIGKGYNMSADELFFLSGNSVPRYLEVKSNLAWVRFTSDQDDSSRHHGFDAHVTSTCRNDAAIEHSFDTRGTAVALSNGDIYSISSPNYPNDYGNQQHIAWMFRIPDNCQLNIVMNDFQTDGTDDKVTIRTPESVVSEFNGDAIPEPSFINSTVTIVKFDSGFSGTSRGFQADISPICDIITTETPSTISPVIQPIEPLTVLRGQPTRVMCTVILGDLPIHFRWLKDGDVIPLGVGVEFVNGAFSSSVVIADASIVHDGRYTCEASNLAAAVNYTTALTVQENLVELGRGDSLFVKTPQYIWAYFGDVVGSYTWIVKAPQNCTVRIEFRGLTATVPGDVLEIGSGYNISTNHIWNLTGTEANIPTWFEIDSNVVWMWFRPNDHKIPASSGFSAVLRPTCDQDVNAQSYIDTRGSGVSLSNGDSYTIASPNFPQNHPTYTSTIWLIKLPQPDCQLTIDFDNFTTTSVDNMLQISPSASLDTVRATLYGDVIPEPITFTSAYVLIRFSSRSYYGSDITLGFKAHLYADCESETNDTQPYVDVIGGNVSLSDGSRYSIASPNYPYGKYPARQDITWHIYLTHPRCQLSITFQVFQTERYFDKVYISTQGRERIYYGDVIPAPLIVTSYYVVIRFTSDGLTGYEGFRANLLAQCEEGVSTTMTPGQPNEGTTTPQTTTFRATTPVSSTPSAVVPIQQNVTNVTTGELLRRSYAITDRGMVQMFRGWVDVQGQGAPNDFCRVVRTDGKPFLSCLLAGSEEDDLLAYTSPNPSVEWFDPGYSNTWYMKDEDNDGRDDYCRCIGSVRSTLVVCMKAGANGFEGPGSDFLPPNSPEECLFHQADPFFGF
ncbi:cubilin isoform X1 [Strongylocentrotus purpuratus]|uniref:Uncharacterized protein n=1 Tax=Strongylocentrotus purpuratus TaxID=7668 RepID=A0A7M7PEJ1_STRPU|nr:cubilin isoform X1 [Strongylocentrotus purpuratus]